MLQNNATLRNAAEIGFVPLPMKDKLCTAAKTYATCVSIVDSRGRTIWIADATSRRQKAFRCARDEKPTAFVELEAAVRACDDCLDKLIGSVLKPFDFLPVVSAR